MEYRQVVRQRFLAPPLVGSSPAIPVLSFLFLWYPFSKMAQKIFPRSLRSQKLLSSGFAFYSERYYFPIWSKIFQLTDAVLSFSQRNLRYRNLRKWAKRPILKRKLPTFLTANVIASSGNQYYKISPILFKFASKSESHKYNPMKALFRIRRKKSFLNKNFHRKNGRVV